jgi:CheY-like chemotaxis protein
LELYRIFHQLWLPRVLNQLGDDAFFANSESTGRQALLLTAVEGFSAGEASTILSLPVEEVEAAIDAARTTIENSLRSRILIIEDEAIIAMHIEALVKEAGHEVAGVAQTRTEAVSLAGQTSPELVLADISLADGSSGIDAVREILEMMDVPIIFVTAFPERLLTGERPEPTYLITKPFEPLMLMATIAQALMAPHQWSRQAA